MVGDSTNVSYAYPHVDIHLCEHCGSPFERGQPLVCLSDGRMAYDDGSYDVDNRRFFHRDCWADYRELHTGSAQEAPR